MGGFTAPAATYPGTGSLAIANAAPPAGLDLTAEGTLDWATFKGNSFLPRSAAAADRGAKIRARVGSYIADSIDCVKKTYGAIATDAGGVPTQTTTDNIGPDVAALATVVHCQDGSGGVVNVGFGFRLRAEAATTQRVLRVYGGGKEGTVRCYARLTDGSAAEVTSDFAFVAAAYRMWTITFTAARDGQFCEVELLMNARTAVAFAEVRFVCATLALV